MHKMLELRTKADAHFFAHEFLLALACYGSNLALQPRDIDARLRVADCLLGLGEVQKAAVAYTAVAKIAANGGHPLRALIAIKILSALEPELNHLITPLAQLYSKDSTRLGRASRMQASNLEQTLPTSFSVPTLSSEALIAQSEQLATDIVSMGNFFPPMLPPIPFFSGLDEAAFAALMRTVTLLRFAPGEIIFNEGDSANAFYVLARGRIQLSRSNQTSTLEEGSTFGEVALFSKSKRLQRATSLTDCDVFVFEKKSLVETCAHAPSLETGLDRYMKERLIINTVMTAPLFVELDRKQKMDLIKRFECIEFKDQDILAKEGQATGGVFLLIAGKARVIKQNNNERSGFEMLSTLNSGDIFGEISTLNDGPAIASVMGYGDGIVLFLAAEMVHKLIAVFPHMGTFLSEVGHKRILANHEDMVDTVDIGDSEELFLSSTGM